MTSYLNQELAITDKDEYIKSYSSTSIYAKKMRYAKIVFNLLNTTFFYCIYDYNNKFKFI